MADRRFPFADLARAMGVTEHAACVALSVSGSTEQDYRRRGLTARVAERLAERARLHPYEVWPELLDEVLAGMERQCEAQGCTNAFIDSPGRGGPRRRWCSRRCAARENARKRYHEDAELRARRIASASRYYEDCGEYARARQREWERKNRDRINARRRARSAERTAA